MANGITGGLFGPSPSELGAARQQQRLSTLSQFGQVPLGTLGGGMAGLLAGEAFNQLAGGDQELQRASLLQEAQQEVAQTGLVPGDPGFGQAAVQALRRRGLNQEALEAQVQAQQFEQQALETQGMRAELAPADPAAMQNNVATLQQLIPQMTPEVAMSVAGNPKLFESVVANRLKTAKGTTDWQNYQSMVSEGYRGDFQSYLREFKNRGTQVNVNNVLSKPVGKDARSFIMPDGGPADGRDDINTIYAKGGRVMTLDEETAMRAEATGRTEVAIADRVEANEVFNTIQQIEEVVSKDFSFWEVLGDLRTYNALTDRLAKAVAQLRNPDSAEAADQAQIRILEQFPPFAFARTAENLSGFRGLINALLTEARQRHATVETVFRQREAAPVTPRQPAAQPGLTGDPQIDKYL